MASGGSPGYSWKVTAGAVPGLTLASDGSLSGTPTTMGSFNFTYPPATPLIWAKTARDTRPHFVSHLSPLMGCSVDD